MHCVLSRWQKAVPMMGLAATAVLVLTGEAAGQPSAPARETPAASGSISGVVRFENDYPRMQPIRVSKDNDVCGTRKEDEMFIVSPKTRGLKNVLLTVEGVTGGKAAEPVSEITLAQKGCAYTPHFQVAQLGPDGMTLKIVNDDGILHNVHAYQRKRTLFNMAQPKTATEITQQLRHPGVVMVKCDVHEWMNGYIVLLRDQPYYGVTDEEGRFEILDVPAGTYTLKAWHEALGEMEKSVTVSAGAAAQIDFTISPRAKK